MYGVGGIRKKSRIINPTQLEKNLKKLGMYGVGGNKEKE